MKYKSLLFLSIITLTYSSTVSYIGITLSCNYKNNRWNFDFAFTPKLPPDSSEPTKQTAHVLTGVLTGFTNAFLQEGIKRYNFTDEKRKAMLNDIIKKTEETEALLEQLLKQKQINYDQSSENQKIDS